MDADADADWSAQVQGDIATCVPAVGRAKVREEDKVHTLFGLGIGGIGDRLMLYLMLM